MGDGNHAAGGRPDDLGPVAECSNGHQGKPHLGSPSSPCPVLGRLEDQLATCYEGTSMMTRRLDNDKVVARQDSSRKGLSPAGVKAPKPGSSGSVLIASDAHARRTAIGYQIG